ncbi:MAG: hypothetical protein IV085_14270 [Thiobacillus sp.]|nr:hypothetical protein [Thiobacillus sp.]
MDFFRYGLLLLSFIVSAAQAEIPDYRAFPAQGKQLLLWVSSERGRAEPELQAASKLAAQGVEVWSLDPLGAYFLPQLSRSMDAVPQRDLAEWLNAALATHKRVVVYAVSRAAVPVLRAASLLKPAQRRRLGMVLMYPNLYTTAEPMAAPDYLDVGALTGLQIRILQPRRSAATPWLPGLVDHLKAHGAQVSHRILENLREGYWARETPTDFEIAESRRMDVLVLREMKQSRNK